MATDRGFFWNPGAPADAQILRRSGLLHPSDSVRGRRADPRGCGRTPFPSTDALIPLPPIPLRRHPRPGPRFRKTSSRSVTN